MSLGPPGAAPATEIREPGIRRTVWRRCATSSSTAAGTPDDARTLLTVVSTAMIGVIATVFGLAVVALQLSSTQFSPRDEPSNPSPSSAAARCVSPAWGVRTPYSSPVSSTV